jgi:NTE family protein
LRSLPDVLVLGAGGTLGIAWLHGLLAGIEEAGDLDLRRCEYFVGTSAGSYVGAYLAAGKRPAVPERLADVAAEAPPEGEAEFAPGSLRRAGRLAAAVTAPVVPLALRASRPGGAAARAALLRVSRRPEGRDLDLGPYIQQLGAFDGRLRVATVDRSNGKRVMFGSPRAPAATVAEAVLASCSVPWLFPPVEIDGREYVDGGVWSMSNLDAAPAGRGSEVLALLPTFGRGGRGPAALLRAAGQAAGLAELQVLRSRGARTRIVSPDAACFEAMGPSLMDGERREVTIAAARAQGRRLAGG